MATEGRRQATVAGGTSGAMLEARPVGDGAAADADVTYTVLLQPDAAPQTVDRRGTPRLRTRLRSGKVVGLNGWFLIECTVYDLSVAGSRIRYPTGTILPDQFHLYDDQSGQIHHATTLWRRANESGLAFKPQALSPELGALAAAMRRKFYTLRR